MVDIEGYEMFFITQKGVALYIDKSYKSKCVISMSMVIDNIMECITVEIETGKKYFKMY